MALRSILEEAYLVSTVATSWKLFGFSLLLDSIHNLLCRHTDPPGEVASEGDMQGHGPGARLGELATRARNALPVISVWIEYTNKPGNI